VAEGRVCENGEALARVGGRGLVGRHVCSIVYVGGVVKMVGIGIRWAWYRVPMLTVIAVVVSET
jgi:hypothetical protein